MPSPNGNEGSHGFLFTAPLGKRAQATDFVIDKTQLINIGWGLGLSASGGGGSFVDGIGLAKTMIDNGFKSITAKSTSTAPANEYTAIAGGMGAPSAIGGKLEDFVASCIAALDALTTPSYVITSITGITPIEAGPVNALLAIYMSHNSNGKYALYDCDGAGRAVPSLTNLLFDYEGISFSPSAQANLHSKKPTQVNTTWTTGGQGEAGLRDIIDKDYGGAIGLAAWTQSGTQLSKAALNLGTFQTAAKIGAELQKKKSDGQTLAAYLKTLTPSNPQFAKLNWLANLDEVYIDLTCRSI